MFRDGQASQYGNTLQYWHVISTEAECLKMSSPHFGRLVNSLEPIERFAPTGRLGPVYAPVIRRRTGSVRSQ